MGFYLPALGSQTAQTAMRHSSLDLTMLARRGENVYTDPSLLDVAGAWYSRPDPFYRRQPLVSEQSAREAVGEAETVGNPGWKDSRGLFYLYCCQQGRWPQEVAGHDPDSEPGAFDPFCPMRNVTADHLPTLLIHGDQDTDMPYEQSVMMADELDRAGVEYEFITIRCGGHCSLGPDGAEVAATYARITAFLDRHLGPP